MAALKSTTSARWPRSRSPMRGAWKRRFRRSTGAGLLPRAVLAIVSLLVILVLSLIVVRESTLDSERGLAMLAHLPVYHAHSQPYLAGLAMHRMILHLESQGRIQSAASLREELARLVPRHPAVVGDRSSR